MKFQKKYIILIFYIIFLAIPLYWMLNCSFKYTEEILTKMTFFPENFTLRNYTHILENEVWRSSIVNSLVYVLMNVVMVIVAAVPAAYAFSRWRFKGDKHLFFWLFTNRMAPVAIFMVPMFNLYSNMQLFDTHLAVALSHCLFNLPLAIWILEGFMSGIPKELDETAFIDEYSFKAFFVKIFLPLLAPGIGVAAFFCFMYSWTEVLLTKTLTGTSAKPIVVQLLRSMGAEGWDWGVLTAAGVLTMLPGIVMVYFIRNYIAKGFAMGRV
jgi:glycerol transport system permease protein